MNKQTFLLIFCVASNVLALNFEHFKNFPPSELSKIKLRSCLNENLPEDSNTELANLEKLSEAVKWFKEINELEGLTSETLKAIEAEKMEFKTLQKLQEEVEAKGSTDEYVKALAETVEGFDKTAVNFDQNQIVSVKKWILACKFLPNNVCTAADVEGLKNDSKTAISILQKHENAELLLKLSSRAKVQVWPENLNISRLVARLRAPYIFAASKDDNVLSVAKKKFQESILIKKAGEAMKKVLDEMKQVLDSTSTENNNTETNNQASTGNISSIKNEIDMRAKFMEEFLKPEAKTIMTIPKLSLKKDAFIRLIDTLLEKMEIAKDLKEEDLVIFKQWLFFNQMILALDSVTRSGKFVKPWPEGFKLEKYEMPAIDATNGYFYGLPKLEVEEEIMSGRKRFKRKSIASRLKSIFGFGKKSDDAEQPVENKNIVSKALDKGASLVKGAVSKISGIFGSKVEGATEAKPEENKGFLSRMFGGTKKEDTPAVEGTNEAKPKENKGVLNWIFGGSKKEETTTTKPAADATKPAENKRILGMIFGSSSTPTPAPATNQAATETGTNIEAAKTKVTADAPKAPFNTTNTANSATVNTTTNTKAPVSASNVSNETKSTAKAESSTASTTVEAPKEPEKKGYFSWLSWPSSTPATTTTDEQPKKNTWW